MHTHLPDDEPLFTARSVSSQAKPRRGIVLTHLAGASISTPLSTSCLHPSSLHS